MLDKKNIEGIQKDAKSGDVKWPGGIVPYEILLMNATHIKMIEDAVAEFNEKTCVTFREKDDDDIYFVRFILGGGGCNSMVGNIGKPGGQDINLGNGCYYPGTIRHEMMHALGFFHEQSRTDRDDYIKILWDNIIADDEDQFTMSNKYEEEDLDTSYDYGSVMHYMWNAFAVDKTEPTITKMDDSTDGIGQRVGFSPGDIYQINKYYNCPETGAAPPKGVKPKMFGTTQKTPDGIDSDSSE